MLQVGSEAGKLYFGYVSWLVCAGEKTLRNARSSLDGSVTFACVLKSQVARCKV